MPDIVYIVIVATKNVFGRSRLSAFLYLVLTVNQSECVIRFVRVVGANKLVPTGDEHCNKEFDGHLICLFASLL